MVVDTALVLWDIYCTDNGNMFPLVSTGGADPGLQGL